MRWLAPATQWSNAHRLPPGAERALHAPGMHCDPGSPALAWSGMLYRFAAGHRVTPVWRPHAGDANLCAGNSTEFLNRAYAEPEAGRIVCLARY